MTYYVAELYDKGTKSPYKTKYFGMKEFPTEESVLVARRMFKAENKKNNRLYRLKKLKDEEPLEVDEIINDDHIPIEITDFELKLDRNTGNTTAIIGSSKAGKSTLMMHIYKKYYKRFITTLYTMNPHSFGGKVDDRNLIIFGGYEDKVIKAEKLINQNCNNKYNFCNLFDDLIGLNNKTLINNLILTYRNSNMSSVICIQYSNLLSKMTRANFNNILLFRFNTDEAIEVVIKTFLRNALKKMGVKDMIEFYKLHTSDFSFMYYIPSTEELSFHKLNL